MRKRRKKGALLMEQEGKKSKNEMGIVDENESNPDSLNACGEGTIGEDQYNGFINTTSEKFLAIPPTYDGSECNEIEVIMKIWFTYLVLGNFSVRCTCVALLSIKIFLPSFFLPCIETKLPQNIYKIFLPNFY